MTDRPRTWQDEDGRVMQDLSVPVSDPHHARMGRGWLECRNALDHLARDGIRVTRLTIKGGWTSGETWLVILCAATAEGPMVAFHNADDPETLWVGLCKRIEKGSLKWRPDEYAT